MIVKYKHKTDRRRHVVKDLYGEESTEPFSSQTRKKIATIRFSRVIAPAPNRLGDIRRSKPIVAPAAQTAFEGSEDPAVAQETASAYQASFRRRAASLAGKE
jgi:hypothetical protein